MRLPCGVLQVTLSFTAVFGGHGRSSRPLGALFQALFLRTSFHQGKGSAGREIASSLIRLGRLSQVPRTPPRPKLHLLWTPEILSLKPISTPSPICICRYILLAQVFLSWVPPAWPPVQFPTNTRCCFRASHSPLGCQTRPSIETMPALLSALPSSSSFS